jgi:mannose-6-phosphate isomerase-like protein (cupin superfamily)
MPINPEQDFVYLEADGNGRVVPGGDAFWSQPESEVEAFGRGWLITEFECAHDWSNWEMHPVAEEFVYLLSGDIEFHLQGSAGLEITRIRGRGAVVVPRGKWHTAKVLEPSRMLFVTMGSGTQHRPVVAA